MPQRSPSRHLSHQPYHHGDLKHALIDTALAMVTEEGTWSFTLREVARRAGVSHAAPDNHFADKTELLAEVAALGFQALGRAMETAARRARSARAGTAPNRHRVRAVWGGEPGSLPAHVRGGLAERERYPGAAQPADATFAALTGALERGQATGEVRRGAVREQAVSAWSLVHGLTMLLLDQRLGFLGLSIAEAERQARAAGTALFQGLKTENHRGTKPQENTYK